MSHEGGLLLSFGGSSPALDSIIIRASDGIYIGKIDGVLGNTDSPMAHVGHIDRKLDLNSLVGEEVTIRPKKPREERYPSSRDRDSRGDGRRDGGRGNFDRGSRDRRDGGRRDGDRGNFDRGNRGRNDSNDGDWDCPKCNNSNFARRTECNRCGEPRGAGGGRRDGGRGNFDRGSRDRRDGGRGNFDRGSRDRRDGGRGNFDRGSRDGGSTFAHNDWDCPKCNNSNFSFRRECNRCGEPRSGGGGDRRDGGRRDGGRGNFDRGSRDRRDGGRGNFDRGSRDRRDGGRRDGGRGNFDRGNRGRNDSNDGDWDCPKCNNSNFARRTECNRCGEPRGSGGGRRDGGRGNFDRGSRDRRDGGRRDGGRGNFDRGSRDRRDGGRRDGGRGNFDRDSRGGGRDGGRGERRDFSSRDDDRTKPRENNFRKSKGKRAGHAHNNAPKPIIPRKFNRNSDD